MIGYFAIAARVLLYALGGAIANEGIGSLDTVNGTITINIEATSKFLGSGALILGTWAFSRWRKVRGGAT